MVLKARIRTFRRVCRPSGFFQRASRVADCNSISVWCQCKSLLCTGLAGHPIHALRLTIIERCSLSVLACKSLYAQGIAYVYATVRPPLAHLRKSSPIVSWHSHPKSAYSLGQPASKGGMVHTRSQEKRQLVALRGGEDSGEAAGGCVSVSPHARTYSHPPVYGFVPLRYRTEVRSSVCTYAGGARGS